MYFTDDSLLPENQNPLIITAAPWGPSWLPGDYPEDIAVSWDDQVQKAVDCFNAGASILHVHVRDPQTGKLSKKMSDFNYMIERLRKAVPKMVLQVGGSISFAPENENDKAKWLAYDTRHMLAEITPKPDQVTVAIGTSQYDVTSMLTADDVAGTHMADPKVIWNYSQMVADATPEFYIEHLKRLRQHEIQPYFALGHVHNLEIVERLIRARPLHGADEWFLQYGRRRRGGLQSFRLHGADPPHAAWLHLDLSVDDAPGLANPDDEYLARTALPHRHRGEPLGHAQGRAHAHRQTGRKAGPHLPRVGTRDCNCGRRPPHHEDRNLVQHRRRNAVQSRPAAEPRRRANRASGCTKLTESFPPRMCPAPMGIRSVE